MNLYSIDNFNFTIVYFKIRAFLSAFWAHSVTYAIEL